MIELDTSIFTDKLNKCFQACFGLGHCLAFHSGGTCLLLLSDPFDSIKQLEDSMVVNFIEENRLT